MRNNASTISIANASTADYANIDMNASTSITGSLPGAIKTRLKLQSGIDEAALNIDTVGQTTATYLFIDSAATVTTSGGSASSDYRTAIYPNKLYLIGKPVGANDSYLYLNNYGITCSKGWGYSDKTDIHTAFINSPSYIYTTKITPNATTTAWNTVTIPALKIINRFYFVVKIGDYMVQNTFIDKRTNGNASTMTYSAYSGPGYFACILVSPHFNEGTVSVKWKNGVGWGPAQCDISELWIHPMDHVAP